MFSVARFHSRLPFIQKRSLGATSIKCDIESYLSRLRGLSPIKSAKIKSAKLKSAQTKSAQTKSAKIESAPIKSAKLESPQINSAKMNGKNGNKWSLSSDERIVWVDCEMTGLEVDRNRLVEIACIVTEANLEIVAEIGPICIKQPKEVMDDMSDWCKSTFKKNGLIDRIEKDGIPEHDAEAQVLAFLKEHVKWNKCPLAGNSVHMDRQFLAKYMPKVMTYLHYRIIDVSSIKELVKRWYPAEELDKIPQKKLVHLALDDIKESIDELRYYREHFFKQPIPAQVVETEKNGEAEPKIVQ